MSCLDQSKKDDGRQKEVEDESDKRDESEAESALIGLDTLLQYILFNFWK